MAKCVNLIYDKIHVYIFCTKTLKSDMFHFYLKLNLYIENLKS